MQMQTGKIEGSPRSVAEADTSNVLPELRTRKTHRSLPTGVTSSQASGVRSSIENRLLEPSRSLGSGLTSEKDLRAEDGTLSLICPPQGS